LEKRADPRQILPEAHTILVLGYNYYQPEPPRRGRIAKYALGADYHKVVLKKLKRLCAQMQAWDGEQKPYVDTGPNLEKPLAALAGLGLAGQKHPRDQPGARTVALPQRHPHDAETSRRRARKKTAAAVAHAASMPARLRPFPPPYQLDARRCLSYLTIEHRGSFPVEFRRALGNQLFGCDICLDICPWNRWARATREAKFAPRPYPDLRDMLAWDETTFRETFAGSPLRRPGLQGWKRNVCVVLGNIGTLQDLPDLDTVANGDDALLAEHARWAIREITTRESQDV
jgi:epoxyqueuosine reductase